MDRSKYCSSRDCTPPRHLTECNFRKQNGCFFMVIFAFPCYYVFYFGSVYRISFFHP